MADTEPKATRSPLATVEDLAKFWRPLTDAEKPRAEYLLEMASDKLRQIAKNNGQDIDKMIEEGVVLDTVVKLVVMEAVKRAMNTPTDAPPVDSYSQTAGPYSENFKYSNPSGDIWFKKAELASIGLSGGQKLTSISLTNCNEVKE